MIPARPVAFTDPSLLVEALSLACSVIFPPPLPVAKKPRKKKAPARA